MTDNLPTTFNGGGGDNTSGRTFLKFVDGRWSAKDGTELGPSTSLMCVGTDTAVQRFVDGKPETIYDKPLPDPDDLNAAIPQDDMGRRIRRQAAPAVVEDLHRQLRQPDRRVDVHLQQFDRRRTHCRRPPR